MGIKARLMAQAAAAQAEAEAAASSGAAAAASPGEAQLWKLQSDLVAVEDLATDLEACFQPRAPRAKPAASDEEPAEGKKKYKWTTSLDTLFKFDFDASVPVRDIGAINWRRDVRGVEKSDAGSEGVFFIDTTEGALVVKGSRSIGSEAFSCLLATKLGVYGPRWRVLTTDSSEGQAMVAALREVDPMGRVYTNLAAQTHLLLKAFLPGANLGQVSPEHAARVFSSGGELSDNGRARLRELGRVLALDVLCNNGDRLPLIWDNRGNPGNVMLAVGVGKVVSIDSQVVPIDAQHAAQRQEYLAKVEQLLKDTMQASTDKVEAEQFAVVRAKMIEFTGHDYAAEGSMEVQEGLLDVVRSSGAIDITAEEMGKWRDALTNFEPPLVGAHTADVAFVSSIWDLFKAARPQ